MFKKKNKPQKKEDNFLLYVPVKKHTTFEVRDGKAYLIFYHRKLIERFLRWLVKKPATSYIELDDIGTIVWLSIDGEKSVYDIGQELKNRLGERAEPIYERLTMYVRYLNRKGWISFNRGKQ